MFYKDNSFSIGRTPLVKLNRVIDGAKATVLAKIEGRGPAFSVKDRIGASMIWDAEKTGKLKPGMHVVASPNNGTATTLHATDDHEGAGKGKAKGKNKNGPTPDKADAK